MNRKSYRSLISVMKKNKGDNSLKRFIFSNILNSDEYQYKRIIRGLSNNKTLANKFIELLLPRKEKLLNYDIIVHDDVDEKGLLSLADYIIVNRINLINNFIKLKKEYENLLYRGEYILARDILDVIDKEICFSMWSCSQRFVLEEQINGLESNKQLLDDYLNVSKNKPVISAILDFMSTLAEKNTSYYTFQDKIAKLLSILEKKKILHNYFSYKFDLEYAFSYSDISSVMQMEFQFSIIDLYESFIYFIIFDSVKEKKYIGLLDNKINDNRLKNARLLSKYSKEMIDVNKNKDYYSIYDLYTKGNYDETINLIRKYHAERYYDFQLVILYVKSHIYLNKKIENESLLIESIFNVYSLNERYDESINLLSMFIKEYAFVDWGIKIKAFIKRKASFDKNDNNLIKVSYLYDTIASPNFVKILSDKDTPIFINDIRSVCPNSAKLFECYFRNEEIVSAEIDEKRKMIYNVLIKNRKGDIDEATASLEMQLDIMYDDEVYYFEKIVRLLFINCLS
ncbi:MAG TPA: hypothetical protein P5191_14530, partial [Ruminococcus sp.]|nr:hypothetical protein [Ruminococcus sp.]